jgi:hypothetical protein
MNIKEIIAALKYFNGAFPKAAVESAITEKTGSSPNCFPYWITASRTSSAIRAPMNL